MGKKKSKIPYIILGVVLVIIIAGVAYGWTTYQNLNKPVTDSSEEVRFIVKSGSSVSSLLDDLENEQIIQSAFASSIYLRINPVESNLKAGEFVIDKSWSLEEMLLYMSDSSNILVDTVNITFIDGQWARDFASEIEQNLGINAQEMLDLWNDETYLKELIDQYEVLTEDILHPETIVKLEGYLAPETYQFYIDATSKEVTERLLSQSETIYLKHKEAFDASELSIHEVYSLASIIQFEAARPEDYGLVASVFLNRLEVPMRLEASVTVCYALYDYETWQECETNIDIDSPYNTYIIDGIPIGPISNPQEAAIESVLYPTESDYYYFVNDVYGDGSVHFARTFAEHTENVNTYLRGRE